MYLLIGPMHLEDLWEAAQGGLEHTTTALWENIFAEVFPFKKYSVASQQPPTADVNDKRRIDLVVRPLGNRRPRAVLFMEANKSRVVAAAIDECERQALTACWGYLLEYNVPAVWAMTCVGSKARLRVCQHPGNSKGQLLGPDTSR